MPGAMPWLEWMRTRLRIIAIDSKKAPFVPNSAQLRLYGIMERQRRAGVPIRIIVLKSRKVGISTAVAAKFFTEIYAVPHRSAFVCAHNAESSEILFNMVRFMYDNMPATERRPTDSSSTRALRFEGPHYSNYAVQTAGNTEIQRAANNFYVHCSELAFYPDAGRVLTAVLNSVPQSPETIIVLESTANGQGGEFYERWHRAVGRLKKNGEDLNGFMPLFISWLDDPNNRRRVPEGYKWDDCPAEVREDEPNLRQRGASNEHLYFRRYMIFERMNGQVDRFRQEFPSTPAEAFLASGRPAIPASIIEYHQKTVRFGQPHKLSWVMGSRRAVEAIPGKYAGDFWKVWVPPQPYKDYIVFGDVSEGKLANASDDQSDPDRHAGVVLDRTDMRIVAEYTSRQDPDVFGEELVKAATWYNEAWASPEANACGIAALAAFREYPRTFIRRSAPDRIEDLPLSEYGWRTTRANRDLMIDDFIAAARPNHNGSFAGKLLVHSADFVDEERTFVIDRNGKRQHMRGYHDDLIMAVCGAIQLHKACPRARPSRARKNPWQRPRRHYRYANGYDPGPEVEAAASMAWSTL